ncbi:hypothetical protein QYF36_008089 [Acer negundo]|nr:hypothetical protein QYF36_008089 [Acer negundo]
MHLCYHKLSRKEFASRFQLVWISNNNCADSYSIGVLIADFGCKRDYHTYNLVQPASEITFNIQSVNNLFRRYSSGHHQSQKFSSGESFSILQSSSLQPWFKNWQELRKYKLTASTFAAAVGFWRHRRVQLWLEKIGAIEPFSGNLATCWSNIKEEEALERYKLITGNSVLFPEFQVYSKRKLEDDWLAASPDGLVDRLVYDLPSRGVLEIKCPFFDGDMTMAFPWKRIPHYCIPQAQGLMEILDRDWMDFYVWTPKGSSLFRLYRDIEYWGVLKVALSDFWWKHVHPARELCSKSVISDPLKQLRYLKPARRHELCSYLVYESKHIVDRSNLLMREIHGRLAVGLLLALQLGNMMEQTRSLYVVKNHLIQLDWRSLDEVGEEFLFGVCAHEIAWLRKEKAESKRWKKVSTRNQLAHTSSAVFAKSMNMPD